MRNNSRKLIFASLLVAYSVILSTVFNNFPVPTIILGFTIRPSIGYLIILLAGLLLGPVYGAAVGGVSDVLGYLMYPQGTFYPGFTLTSILVGLIPGIFYKVVRKSRVLLIAVIIFTALVELVTTTVWYSLYYHIDIKLVFIPRLISGIAIWLIKGICIVTLLEVFKKTKVLSDI
jgi:ECF transporter S component (folate family)